MKYDLTEFVRELGESARDAAEPAARLLGVNPVSQRSLKLIAHRLTGAETQSKLTDGLTLARGGVARRADGGPLLDAVAAEERKAAVTKRRHLEGLAFAENLDFAGADRALAALGAELPKLPDDIAARTAHAVGTRFAQTGKWAEAARCSRCWGPNTPATRSRWMATAGAPRLPRRHRAAAARRGAAEARFGRTSLAGGGVVQAGATNALSRRTCTGCHDPAMIVRWHQACLDMEPKLAAFGPLYSRDPAAWLSLLSARRHVGKHAEADAFLREFFKGNTAPTQPGQDLWRDCLAAELWLADRSLVPTPPKPLAASAFTETRPLLDGKLDDPCWQAAKALPLTPTAATGRPDDAPRSPRATRPRRSSPTTASSSTSP